MQPLRPTSDFLAASAQIGIEFDDGDLEKLGRYLALLLETNKSFNLTAIKDADEAWMRHVYDSLTLLPYVHEAQPKRVIDVGSGGGLPGIPLAITVPQATFTLLEATAKKARFLQDVCAELGLDHVDVINERAETSGRDREHHREQYDLVLSRAVGRLCVLLELTVPLATVGGLVVAVKGEQAAVEVEEARDALHKLHASVIDQHRTETGTVVIIEKQRRTPKMYPRLPGEPKRNPL